MDQTSEALRNALIEEVSFRLFDEGIPRIKKCLSQLNVDEIWFRPNEHVVSIGNLVLHLCGNVRQWLIAGMGGWPDQRNRQREFDEPGPLPTQQLFNDLVQLERDARQVLNMISTEDLLAIRKIQGIFEVSGLSVLVHVTEHFSYHTGQITYFTKVRKNIDLQYYGGMDLDGNAD